MQAAALTPEQAAINQLAERVTTAEAAVTALQAALASAQAANAQAEAVNARQQAALDNLNQRLQNTAPPGTGGGGERCLIDMKGLGKPGTFDSTDHKKFPGWRFRTTNYICGVFQEAETLLEWARSKEEPLGEADLVEIESVEEHELIHISKQVYTVLAAICDGEALSIIMNVPGRNGLEAWRRLNRRFDPKTAGRRKNAMSTILNVKPCSLKELPAAIERWEKHVREYEETSKSTVSELSLIHISEPTRPY